MPLMLGCQGLGVSGQCPPTACVLGPCTTKDEFAAGVVLEGLRPQRIAVDIVNDHDVFVAEAEYLREKPRLIKVHCLL